MEKDNKTSFVFYSSFLSQIDNITNPAMRFLVLDAIVKYGCYGEEPDFSKIDPLGFADALFVSIKNAIDDSKARRAINQMNGSRGGAPKGNRNAVKQPKTTENNQNQPNSTENNLNVIVNDNVNDNENDNENDKDRGQTAKRFTPPSLEEIQSYCSEMGYSLNANAFFDYYQANGWTQGKGKSIKDWKAAIRNWNRREPEFDFKSQQGKYDARRYQIHTTATSGEDYEGKF